jgi:UDP-N-acetyl-D-galactosamine dehydrogenase
MNELSIVFDMMNINTYEVLEAAGTKWNFLKFQPGLVGGHCIGVDPYYLTHKAQELGYHPQVILAGRSINDNMGSYVAKKIVQHLIKHDGDLKKANILVMGATFKENVSDIRNSKVVDVVKNLKSYYVNVDVHDPYADSEHLMHEYGFGLAKEMRKDYDAVVIAVPHKTYMELDDNYFCSITKQHGLIADLKGIFRNKISNRSYWSL